MKKSYFEPTTEMVKVAVDQILMGSYDGNATGPGNLGDPTNLTDEQMTTIFG